MPQMIKCLSHAIADQRQKRDRHQGDQRTLGDNFRAFVKISRAVILRH